MSWRTTFVAAIIWDGDEMRSVHESNYEPIDGYEICKVSKASKCCV